MTRRFHKALIAIAAAILFVPIGIEAQASPVPAPRGERMTGPMIVPRALAPDPLTLALEHAEYLSLSDQQQTQIRALQERRIQISEEAGAVIDRHREQQRAEVRERVEERREAVQERLDERRSEIRERMQEMDRARLQERRPVVQRRMMVREMRQESARRIRQSRAPAAEIPAEVREARASIVRIEQEIRSELTELLSAEQRRDLRTLSMVGRTARRAPLATRRP